MNKFDVEKDLKFGEQILPFRDYNFDGHIWCKVKVIWFTYRARKDGLIVIVIRKGNSVQDFYWNPSEGNFKILTSDDALTNETWEYECEMECPEVISHLRLGKIGYEICRNEEVSEWYKEYEKEFDKACEKSPGGIPFDEDEKLRQKYYDRLDSTVFDFTK